MFWLNGRFRWLFSGWKGFIFEDSVLENPSFKNKNKKIIQLPFRTKSLKIHISVFPIKFYSLLLTYLNLNSLLALLTFTNTMPRKPCALFECFCQDKWIGYSWGLRCRGTVLQVQGAPVGQLERPHTDTAESPGRNTQCLHSDQE